MDKMHTTNQLSYDKAARKIVPIAIRITIGNLFLHPRYGNDGSQFPISISSIYFARAIRVSFSSLKRSSNHGSKEQMKLETEAYDFRKKFLLTG